MSQASIGLNGLGGEALLVAILVGFVLAVVAGIGLARLVFTAARESRRPRRKDRT